MEELDHPEASLHPNTFRDPNTGAMLFDVDPSTRFGGPGAS